MGMKLVDINNVDNFRGGGKICGHKCVADR